MSTTLFSETQSFPANLGIIPAFCPIGRSEFLDFLNFLEKCVFRHCLEFWRKKTLVLKSHMNSISMCISNGLAVLTKVCLLDR